MRTAIYIILILISFSLTVENDLLANEKNLVVPPHFFNIGSTTNKSDSTTSALSMQCFGDKPYNVIDCYFTEINIRKKSGEQKEEDTCEIRQYLYFNTMHRVSKYRWVSERYGGGMRSIEYDPKNRYVWRYSEVTNDTPSKTIVFSWEAPTNLTLDCKKIKFIGSNKGKRN